MGNDPAKVKNWFQRVSRAAKELGSTQKRFRLLLGWLKDVYLPLIPLTDGGRARGRMVGLLHQLNIRVDLKVVQDRALVPGKFDSAEFAAGIREGRAVKPERARVKLRLLYAEARQAIKRQRLKNKGSLAKVVKDHLKREMNNGRN